MSVLFPSISRVSTAVALLNEYSNEHVALIGNDLWKSLVPGGDSRQKITISITSHPSGKGKEKEPALGIKSLICWAQKTSEVVGLALPRSWAEAHPTVISPSTPQSNSPSTRHTHEVTLAKPPLLTEVFLSASSPSAFELARSSPKQIEEWFTTDLVIIRQGSIYEFGESIEASNDHGPPTPPKYTVLVCEPVLQGCAVTGSTRFYIVPSMQNPNGIPNGIPTRELDELDGTSDGGFEIDESFLANSVLGSLTDVAPHSFRSSSDDISGDDVSPRSSHHKRLPNALFRPHPLKSHPSETLDGDCIVYIRTHDLGKVGAFSGDWVIVRPNRSSISRLARVVGADDIVPKAAQATLLLSPILLHNLGVELTNLELPRVLLHSSPFGSHPPPVPTAKVVTVARVASPYSVDRKFLPLFVRALKAHFDWNRRLLKKGDIIAVGINLDQLGLSQETTVEGSKEGTNDLQDNLDFDFPLSSKVPTNVVFFKVTNLEYDILDTSNSTASADAYVAATMGELGCWMDPKITKMVQTGVEYCRVPDVVHYLRLNTTYVPLPEQMASPSLMAPSSPFTKLFDFAKASLHPSAADYDLQISILLKGARGIGKQTVASWVAQKLGFHLLEVNCFDVVGENDVKTEGTLRARFDKAAACSPCLFLLRHIDALARTTQTLESGREPAMATVIGDCLVELRKTWKQTGFPVILVGTTSDPEHVPPSVLACFKHEVLFEAPGEVERLDILNLILYGAPLSLDVSIKTIATQTAALVASDLVDLISRVQLAAMKRVMDASAGVNLLDIFCAGVPLTGKDFDYALSKARASYSESIGAPQIPKVSWEDVGGLASVKADILDTIQLPLDHPELFADGLKKRSGILLYGPPGTGKTLLAKAVATSCSLNFFSVKGPELLNMYIGESEANVRRVFQRARDAKPCVIFFDELDSVAPKRGNHGDSGGVMDRIVSQLLAELDGMSDGKSGTDVFVIGATNRPDLLDPALLRPGRFDRMLYLGVSDTHESQLKILEALTRKFRLDPRLDLGQVAERCPFNYTGADFYALCSDAMLKAMSRKAEEVEVKIAALNRLPPNSIHPYPITPQYYLAELASPEDTDILVSQLDFQQALQELVPSVSQSEMEHYKHVQQRFSKGHDENSQAPLDTVESGSVSHGPSEPLVSRRDKGKGKAFV